MSEEKDTPEKEKPKKEKDTWSWYQVFIMIILMLMTTTAVYKMGKTSKLYGESVVDNISLRCDIEVLETKLAIEKELKDFEKELWDLAKEHNEVINNSKPKK